MKRTEGEIRANSIRAFDSTGIKVGDITFHTKNMSPKALTYAKHLAALWDASIGIDTPQAVTYLRHGADLVKILKRYIAILEIQGEGNNIPAARTLLTKLEVDHGA